MLKIGLMGTGMVADHALLKAAAENPEVSVPVIAARDGDKAARYAQRHGIAESCTGFEALLHRTDIDAVYLPLANHVHEEWVIRALRAGKHVLCEKPLAANADAAKRICEESQRHALVLWEGFAFRHHPFWRRLLELLPEIGRVKHIRASYCMPIPNKSWNVYNYELAGGSMMDTGCYTLAMVRAIAQHARPSESECEPTVTRAVALLLKTDPRIDRAMKAELDWGEGMTGSIHSSIWSRTLLKISVHVEGERGSLHGYNPILPWFWNRLTLKTGDGTRREKTAGTTTFDYQLEDFAQAVAAGVDSSARINDALNNMRALDAVYKLAGMSARPSQPGPA
jgi:predicted dehydrogenase